MNHRIFERTLRPLAFRGACLFERHFNPQALLGIGRRLLLDAPGRPRRRRSSLERSSEISRFGGGGDGLPDNRPLVIIFQG